MSVVLLSLLCIAAGRPAPAQSSFGGVLLAGNGSGMVAGTVRLTVSGGHVAFQSTLFQAWATNTTLAPRLDVENDHIAFNLGTGTPGSWPAQEFIGPLPGQSTGPTPSQRFPNLEQMPGPQTFSAGVRFAGSFTAFGVLENALLTSGGKISLRVKGTVDGMENPVAVETLVTTASRISNQFAILLTGTNDLSPDTRPHYGHGSCTLDGNSLTCDLAFDSGFRPIRVGIFSPVGSLSRAPRLVANFHNYIVTNSGDGSGAVVYRGRFNLTRREIEELRRGELYANAFSPQYPREEVRGSILPIPVPVQVTPSRQPVITVAPK